MADNAPAWIELVYDRPQDEPPYFIRSYNKEARAFLHWCTNAVFEGQTILDECFADGRHSPLVTYRDDYNDARLSLYWFLVRQRKSLEVQNVPVGEFPSTGLPIFLQAGNNYTIFDAFFVLSSFIFGFCTPEPLPRNKYSISHYAMARLGQIAKWPHGYVWHHLHQTVSLASRLHQDGDFLQEHIQVQYLEPAISGSYYEAESVVATRVAAELHPQPLPEVVDGPHLDHDLSSNTFEDSQAARPARRSWFSRLSAAPY